MDNRNNNIYNELLKAQILLKKEASLKEMCKKIKILIIQKL